MTADLKTLAKAWDTFCEEIMPSDAPTIQYVEMRRAFYAGAAALAKITNRIGGPDVSEEEAMSILNGVHRELGQFGIDLQNGKV